MCLFANLAGLANTSAFDFDLTYHIYHSSIVLPWRWEPRYLARREQNFEMFTFSPSLPDPGSRIAMLKSVQRNIGKEPVPRELLAFCYLCPLDAPAVTKLCKLSKEDLIHWGKKCREAAEEWCSSSWNSEVKVQSDSNPTYFSTQVQPFLPLLSYPSSKNSTL